MRRISVPAWQDWIKKTEGFGYDYHTLDDGTCSWRDGVAYAFSEAEVDQISDATGALHQLCKPLVSRVVDDDALLTRFGIPDFLHAYLRHVWDDTDRNTHYLLGRMDLGRGTDGQVKLLEYNADTPTTTIETAVIQWQWLQALFPDHDQFNSLHEDLIARFKLLYRSYSGLLQRSRPSITFSPFLNSLEDYRHCEYYAELARQVGFSTEMIRLTDIGYRSDNTFTTLSDQPIKILYKIYPWEMMIRDRFGPVVSLDTTTFLEPIWKMILSSKALLPTLWEMYPGHPNLLRAQWSPDGMDSYVIKPIFSREGQNVTIVRNNQVVSQVGGRYGDYPLIFQDYLQIEPFDGYTPVIGSWIVGDQPAGMIIRESQDLITRNMSACVPHYIE